MTRKDYRLIARAIHEAYESLPTERSSAPEDVREAIVGTLARALARDNERFDFRRFVVACEDGL